MWNYNLEEIVRRIQMEGEIISDDVIKPEIVKNIMYKRSAYLSIGQKVLPAKPWAQLDAKWTFPTEVDGDFPVPEGAIAARSKPVQWVEWGGTMQMAEFRFMMTDFAKARQQQRLVYQAMTRRGAEYLAKVEDQQIVDAVYAGAGATGVTVAAGSEWNSGSATVDIEGDIMEAWGNIVDESNVALEEMKSAALIYPAKLDAQLRGLRMIENINQSLMKYLDNSFGFQFLPTRYYHASSAIGIQDDALLVISGDELGIHGVYNGNAIPLAEQWRVNGRGDEYLIKKLFFTKIQPEDQSTATNKRVCKIANVI